MIDLPPNSDLSNQDAATNYFHQLGIFVEVSIIDESTLSVPAQNPPAVHVYLLENLRRVHQLPHHQCLELLYLLQ